MNRFIRYILPVFIVCTVCGAQVQAEEETASSDPVSAEISADEETETEEPQVQQEDITSDAPKENGEEETEEVGGTEQEVNEEAPVEEETADEEEAVLEEAPVLAENAVLPAEGTVTSKGQIANFKSVMAAGAGLEYMNMFFLGEYPVYCIEPNVAIPMTDGIGPYYTGTEWTDLSEEDRLYCKRVAYFGYGYPDTGTEPVSYAATQMLIWQRTSSRFYEKTIYKTFNMCPGVSFGRQACKLGTEALDEKMSQILELVNGFDRVPSFADEHHGVNSFDVSWDETLDLEDTEHVLEQFEPAEVPEGINIRTDGDHLFVDIDDLYFDGNEDGIVITFRRKEEYWNAMLSGIMLYTSGSSQKLIAENGLFPTYEFSVRIRMPEASVRIMKKDEYGSVPERPTSFMIGWKEDPLKQYASDPVWTDIHPHEEVINDENGEMLYPLSDQNGDPVIFETDESGCAEITGLPADRSWWIREVQTDPSCMTDQKAYEVVSAAAETALYEFVNRLKDTVLEITKCDREAEEQKLNNAKYMILDLNQTAEEPAGFGIAHKSQIAYEKLLDHLPSAGIGDSFSLGRNVFEIISLSENEAVLRDESGRETVIGPDTENPCTLESILSRKKMAAAGDVIEIEGIGYTVMYVSDDEGFIRLSSGNGITDVRRDPLPDRSMRLNFLRTGQSYDLSEITQADSYSLKRSDTAIDLNGNFISSSANTYADVLCLNEKGETVSQLHIVFGSEEKTVDGQIIFEGDTGKQYTRICDPYRHNAPMADVRIQVCRDQKCAIPEAELRSNAYGCLRTDSLSPGTYWYINPVSLETESFTVIPAQRAIGQLRADHLKYGGKYLVCETLPPAGYDYGSEEPCRIFDMTLADGKNEFHEELYNSLRRFRLRVLKVDQDNHSIPLNNAWFTVEDLSEQDNEPVKSSYVQKVNILDIPEGAAAGDTFAVWYAREDGEMITWRLDEIRENDLLVSRMINGRFQDSFAVPAEGYNSSAGILYSDVTRALKPLTEGAVFQTAEKEDPSLIRTYRILSLVSGDAYDLFGNPCQGTMVYEAVVADECDSNASPIRLYAKGLNTNNELLDLDEYVSGALLVRKTVMKNTAPVTLDQILEQGESVIREGGKVSISSVKTAEMPSFETVRKAYEQGSNEIKYGGMLWQIRQTETGYTVSICAKEYALESSTVSGAAEYEVKEDMTITEIARDSSGAVVSLTLDDGRGSSWQISRDPGTGVLSGKCGVYAAVYDMNGNKVRDGYTGSDGRLLFDDLADGDYTLVCEGSEEVRHIEAGMADVTNLKYGHRIRVCETKSPLGYMIGNACAVIIPTGDDTDTITNMRPNAKTVTHVRKVLKMRKMGDEE